MHISKRKPDNDFECRISSKRNTVIEVDWDTLLRNIDWNSGGLYLALAMQLEDCTEEESFSTVEELMSYWDEKALSFAISRYCGSRSWIKPDYYDKLCKQLPEELMPLNSVTSQQIDFDSFPKVPYIDVYKNATLNRVTLAYGFNVINAVWKPLRENLSGKRDTRSNRERKEILKIAFQKRLDLAEDYNRKVKINSKLVGDIRGRLSVRSLLILRLINKGFDRWVTNSAYWKVLVIGDYNFRPLQGYYSNYRKYLPSFCKFLERTCLEEIVWENSTSSERELLPHMLSLFSKEFLKDRLRLVTLSNVGQPLYIKSWNPVSFGTDVTSVRKGPVILDPSSISEDQQLVEVEVDKIYKALSNHDDNATIDSLLTRYSIPCKHKWSICYSKSSFIARQCIHCLELIVLPYNDEGRYSQELASYCITKNFINYL